MIFRSCQKNRGLGFATTVAALLFLLSMIGCEKNEAPPPPAPPEVEVTTVIEQNVPIFKEWVAQLKRSGECGHHA